MRDRTVVVITEELADQLRRGVLTKLQLRPVVSASDYTVIGHAESEHDTLEVAVGDGGLTIDWSGDLIRGSVPHPDGTRRAVDMLRVVGSRIRILLAGDGGPVPALFNRQVLAFGEAGQRLLGRLQVGVVGAGGTGSAVCEQLIRLGIGHITAIDPDVVSASNTSRIWGSSAADAGKPKVDLVARTAASVRSGTQVTAIYDTIAHERAARQLRHCDVIFGCTDDNVGRLVLSRLAYMYEIPTFDMGVRIDTDGTKVCGIDARLTYMSPGRPCLECRGWIDHQRLAAEQLPDDEREALVAEGYVIGLAVPDPSVIAYTTAVAAHAIAGLLHRLFGIADAPDDQVLQFHTHSLRSPHRTSQDGHFCADPFYVGAGDLDPFLDRPWTS